MNVISCLRLWFTAMCESLILFLVIVTNNSES